MNVNALLDRLYSLLVKELESEELGELPKGIYKEAAGAVRAVKVEGYDRKSLPSLVSERLRSLILELASMLLEVRVAKAMKEGQEALDRLSYEERFVMEPFYAHASRVRMVKEAIERGNRSFFENVFKELISKLVMVRFLGDAPAVIGPDLKKYGPFKKGDMALIPLDNALVMKKEGLVELIDLRT